MQSCFVKGQQHVVMLFKINLILNSFPVANENLIENSRTLIDTIVKIDLIWNVLDFREKCVALLWCYATNSAIACKIYSFRSFELCTHINSLSLITVSLSKSTFDSSKRHMIHFGARFGSSNILNGIDKWQSSSWYKWKAFNTDHISMHILMTVCLLLIFRTLH